MLTLPPNAEHLPGHIGPENAITVPDYPYGRLRCQIQFWIESHPKHGWRFCSQTCNPKTGRWNAPKRGTYAALGATLYCRACGRVAHEPAHIGEVDGVYRCVAEPVPGHHPGPTFIRAEVPPTWIQCRPFFGRMTVPCFYETANGYLLHPKKVDAAAQQAAQQKPGPPLPPKECPFPPKDNKTTTRTVESLNDLQPGTRIQDPAGRVLTVDSKNPNNDIVTIRLPDTQGGPVTKSGELSTKSTAQVGPWYAWKGCTILPPA